MFVIAFIDKIAAPKIKYKNICQKQNKDFHKKNLKFFCRKEQNLKVAKI